MRVITQFEVTFSGKEVDTLFLLCRLAQELISMYPENDYVLGLGTDKLDVQRIITAIAQLSSSRD